MKTNYPCPCCEYLTMEEPDHLSFDICPICFWEDDAVQFKDPNYRGGANHISLTEARENFKKFRAKEEKVKKFVRDPLPDEFPTLKGF